MRDVWFPLKSVFMHRAVVRKLIATSFAAFLLSALAPWNARAADEDKTDEGGYTDIAIFAKAVELLRQDYVDGGKTSYHNLITAAMKGMLSSLDPHSQYMDP